MFFAPAGMLPCYGMRWRQEQVILRSSPSGIAAPNGIFQIGVANRPNVSATAFVRTVLGAHMFFQVSGVVVSILPIA